VHFLHLVSFVVLFCSFILQFYFAVHEESMLPDKNVFRELAQISSFLNYSLDKKMFAMLWTKWVILYCCKYIQL